MVLFFFFFNDTATTEIYTLSLHDALPISKHSLSLEAQRLRDIFRGKVVDDAVNAEERLGLRGEFEKVRSEEHTSELQSLAYLVCRLLLEKKKTKLNLKLHSPNFQLS